MLIQYQVQVLDQVKSLSELFLTKVVETKLGLSSNLWARATWRTRTIRVYTLSHSETRGTAQHRLNLKVSLSLAGNPKAKLLVILIDGLHLSRPEVSSEIRSDSGLTPSGGIPQDNNNEAPILLSLQVLVVD